MDLVEFVLKNRTKLVLRPNEDTGELHSTDGSQTDDSGWERALGAAMLGAVAAGEAAGGHHSLREAAACMTRRAATQVDPDERASQVYEDLYREYLALHDYFGRGGNDVMTRLPLDGQGPDREAALRLQASFAADGAGVSTPRRAATDR